LGVAGRLRLNHGRVFAASPSQPQPNLTPTLNPAQFGPDTTIQQTYATADGQYILLQHQQKWPIWLFSADGQLWRTTTPPWYLRRVALYQQQKQTHSPPRGSHV
jgi:hypothetical protein